MRRGKIITLGAFIGLFLFACTSAPPSLDLEEGQTDTTQIVPTEYIQVTESPVGGDVDLENLFAPFWESWSIIHDEFISQPVDDEVMFNGAMDGLMLALETMEVDTSALPEEMDEDLLETIGIKANTPRNAEKLFLPFWHLWDFGIDAVMDSGMTYENLMQSALHGMVDSLGDPHTYYVDPDQYQQINIPLEGEYQGIGAWVDTTGDYLTIITPMEGSPAERAGLKPKDKVLAVDGEDMTGIEGNLVIRRVIGPAGTDVVLTILREGVDEPFDITITRDVIILDTLESRMDSNNIGYIHLYNFGDRAARDFEDALKELLDQKAKGIIVDLRNNGGGYVHTTVAITSEFFEDGVVLYEEYGDGSRDVSEVQPGGIAIDIPLVVIINRGSASASEIFAGVVQDMERGILVGTTSFGKGSAQIPFVLTDDRGGLRVTVAMWLTPKERLIHNIGLTPDYIVEITEEDIEAGLDPQLDKALELILELIG